MEQNNRTIGRKKEQIAVWFLEQSGYVILETNYTCKQGEIDIIARKDGYLIFVEVKYRKDVKKGSPSMAVGYYKQEKISKVARYYLYSNGYNEGQPCRFDVVEILGNRIRVLENAFEYAL